MSCPDFCWAPVARPNIAVVRMLHQGGPRTMRALAMFWPAEPSSLGAEHGKCTAMHNLKVEHGGDGEGRRKNLLPEQWKLEAVHHKSDSECDDVTADCVPRLACDRNCRIRHGASYKAPSKLQRAARVGSRTHLAVRLERRTQARIVPRRSRRRAERCCRARPPAHCCS